MAMEGGVGREEMAAEDGSPPAAGKEALLVLPPLSLLLLLPPPPAGAWAVVKAPRVVERVGRAAVLASALLLRLARPLMVAWEELLPALLRRRRRVARPDGTMGACGGRELQCSAVLDV